MRELVKVTVTTEFVYDLDETSEFGIDSPEACVEDVRSMLANGELGSSSFELNVETINA